MNCIVKGHILLSWAKIALACPAEVMGGWCSG